jgi:alpha,alpha-trehalase
MVEQKHLKGLITILLYEIYFSLTQILQASFIKITSMNQQKKVKDFAAVILDLDGVITRTASLHFKAWKALFDQFLQDYDSQQEPFSEEDYDQYVDGKPRYDGVQSFLESRDIHLPMGSEDDEPGEHTVYGLGKEKNTFFHKLLDEEGVEVFDDTLDCISQWKAEGKKLAVVSSSKNCRPVLERAGLIDHFDAIFDGKDAAAKNVSGKPAPDIFLKAADMLEVDPAAAVVVEDAIAVVEAGKRGEFGMVIGVNRNQQESAMKKAGADLVITGLNELK